jgi:hypothetical protein
MQKLSILYYTDKWYFWNSSGIHLQYAFGKHYTKKLLAPILYSFASSLVIHPPLPPHILDLVSLIESSAALVSLLPLH